MNNPNLPHRKIRHAEVMLKAGFFLDKAWMKRTSSEPVRECNVTKLIYWKNEDGISVICFDYKEMSLKTLVKRITDQVKYLVKKNTSIEVKWPEKLQ